MIDEKTIYDSDDKTILDSPSIHQQKSGSAGIEVTRPSGTASGINSAEMGTQPSETKGKAAKGKKKDGGLWRTVAIGSGTGLMFGLGSSILTGSSHVDPDLIAETDAEEVDVEETDVEETDAEETDVEETDVEETDTVAASTAGLSYLVDGDIQMAGSVSDDMSFSQAFAAARAEVGSGGVFEWHGNLYNTFTAEEWNGMSEAERDEYGSHFAWSAHHHTTDIPAADVEIEPDEAPQETVEVVNEDDRDEGTEVEVLGVVHDTETDMNIAGVIVDNEEVVLVDVDNDGTFDVLVSDVNGDGELSVDEIEDISGDGLTVDSMGGFTDQAYESYASNDQIDYSDDGALYEV